MTLQRVSMGEIRRARETANERLRRIESAAEEELRWFFAATQANVSPEGELPDQREPARVIRGRLDRLLTFHVGALALRFTPRSWSAVLDSQYGEWASLVVRMDCAVHPSDAPRSVADCESEAAARVESAVVRNEDRKERAYLLLHAKLHVRAALRAYLRARGHGDSVAPAHERGTL
jgi:hypothetical protein